MTLASSISDPILKSSSRKLKKKNTDTDKIVTKINNIDDRLDCLQRSVANLRTDIPTSVRDLVLRILKEEKLRRANSE